MTPRSLDEWQVHLAEGFARLRKERDAVRPGSPIFALEHGLSLDDELPELQAVVRMAVDRPRLPRTCGLPFVVYASEVGYGYQGDEFWPGFEEATPGWISHGTDSARRFIRQQFEDFAETYGGAQISGRWALFFKNIAWPITHAVLAKDLQRHLARLLFDYRNAITSQLLQDPADLGEQLARRSSDTSARFRNFAENTELLGLVATALLLGEDDDSQLLTPEVLNRLVSDLNRERGARAWLEGAKRAAVRVRMKGLHRSGSAGGASQDAQSRRTWTQIDASFTIRRGPEGWNPYVLIPSHAPLAEGRSTLRDVVERSRYRIEGVAGVQPTGALMYDRGPLPLQSWPATDGAALVSLEAEESGTEPGVLTEHCRMPAGPWLFKITEPGIGRHVRTRTVRMENEYLLVSRDRTVIEGVLCEAVGLSVDGAHALKFTVPSVVDQGATIGLIAAGLSVAPEISLTPVGLVPANWDGEGFAEWSAGESPLFAIRSSLSAARCIAATDTEINEFEWPDDSDTVLLQLDQPLTGTQVVSVQLLDDARELLVQGSVTVTVRDPVDSVTTAAARQGMQVRAFPPHPTLTSLWSGESRIEVTGPTEERVKFTIRLVASGQSGILGRNSFSSQLPVSVDRWWDLLRGTRREHGLDIVVDQADEFIVSVEHPSLGHTEIHTRRPFEPVRWVINHDQRGPFARLVNHTADLPAIQVFPAERPADFRDIPYVDDMDFHLGFSALIHARCGQVEAVTIIPPQVVGGFEALGMLNVRPTLQMGPRSVDSVQQALALARLWGFLPTQVDPSGAIVQSRVLAAIRSSLGGLIGGSYWWDVEKAVLDQRPLTATALRSGNARGASEASIAAGIFERKRTGEDLARLTEFFCDAMTAQYRWLPDSTAKIVAAMAATPEMVDSNDQEVISAIRAVLDRPATFRLARLVAMVESIHPTEEGRWKR